VSTSTSSLLLPNTNPTYERTIERTSNSRLSTPHEIARDRVGAYQSWRASERAAGTTTQEEIITQTMSNTTNLEAEAGKYIGLGLAIAGTLAIGLSLYSPPLWYVGSGL
jgi:hypothetical protein